MIAKRLLGLAWSQWLVMEIAVLTLLLLADALAGHYRTGFRSRAQYVPFVSGVPILFSAAFITASPESAWGRAALEAAGWLLAITGVIGFGFHHYYGIAKQPGGYRWLLHHLMYGAPQLAPLGLTLIGALAIVTARGLTGEMAGANLRSALLVCVAVALTGAILQAAILHYRGAFNNPLMYAPLTVPVLTVVMSAWQALAPSPGGEMTLVVLLWLTFFTGFVGLGMHLRGLDRQMGGLYVSLFNLLEGPPAWAPALFSGFAAVGLTAVYLV